MEGGIYSLIPEQRLQKVMENLQAFTGISIQLIDRDGTLLLSYGEVTRYCSILKKNVFTEGECFNLHLKAGQRAQKIGQAYIFSCHANLSHIAFPLINRQELLGSVIIGPFLMEEPDSTLISGMAEKYHLSPSISLELYDELSGVPMITPDKAGQLQKLVDHLLSPPDSQRTCYVDAEQGKGLPAGKDQRDYPGL